MTNETHNYKQLLELAVLDAHGLLEPIESDLFNRSFHDAPASIQDEIKQMQEEFALDETLLPVEMPPPALRQKVLSAVSETADIEAQRLSPLALIGARASVAQGRLGSSKPLLFWRTAAMVLFGVAVIFAILTLDAHQRTDRITQIALNARTTESLAEMGGVEFKKFIGNPYCQITRLERENGHHSGYLRVAINERFGDGYVLGLDLEDGEEIIIQGTTSDGEVIELARLIAEGPVVGKGFKINPAMVRGLSIAAVDAKTGDRWI